MPPSMEWEVFPQMSSKDRDKLIRWNDAPIIQQLLYNREIFTESEARTYAGKEPSSQITDSFQLPDMAAGVDRIITAIDNKERIVVYGDYDVDGVTATVLLVQLLQAYGADVTPHIPLREHGYGLSSNAVDDLAADGTQLVITVDCGIRSLAEAKRTREAGMDLLITDHHDIGLALPEAAAVINPKREDSKYPQTTLPGVAVAFKLAEALLHQRPPSSQDHGQVTKESLLDLVALGTVADLAPLKGENRELVRLGLKRINSRPRTGLDALIRVSGLSRKITAETIAFQLGPRLNAAGRLGDAMTSFHLLSSQSPKKARSLAKTLEKHNQDRKRETRTLTELALQMIDDTDPLLLSAAHPEFHSGLVGLMASRLKEEKYRPAIIAQHNGSTTTGSARSIPEFNITAALDKCKSLLTKYGGHNVAAGFTLETKNWEPFVAQMQELAATELTDPKKLCPKLTIDIDNVKLRDFLRTYQLDSKQVTIAKQLLLFEPTGNGNPSPTFLARDINVISKRTVGAEGQHLKLKVSQHNSEEEHHDEDDGQIFDAIAFGFGERSSTLPDRIDLVFELVENHWRGKRTLQLQVRDMDNTKKR